MDGREPGFDRELEAPLVVVGGGIAGLSACLEAADLLARQPATDARVLLLSKVAFSPRGSGGSSVWAQGGIAAAVGAGDSPQDHATDTMAAGAGLSDRKRVAQLTGGGPQSIERLLAYGARFDRDQHGALALGREAAHGRHRILHADGDATGAEVVRALATAVAEHPRIEVLERTEALDLVVAPEEGVRPRRVVGLTARAADGAEVLLWSPAVVLATGGLGRLYLHSTNPPESTGDGLALAARAGARLADLEMVQFHPTALDVAEVGNPAGAGGRPLPLVTEALRGEGAVLLDGRGRRFMLDEHPEAELAPRDIVARALWRRRAAGETVYLDATEAVGEAFPKRFPTVYRLCREHGVDPRREPIPVTPAAHFHMGGIAVDDQGRSSLEGLWACGEVACTGVHGANRLASNSLLEGLVFGRTLGRRAVEAVAECEVPSPALHLHLAREAFRALPPVLSPGSAEAREEGELILRIRTALWRHVGLIRDQGSLRRALGLLGRLAWRAGRSDPRLRNLHQVARLVTLAALERRESRGGHFRSDYPVPDPSWRRRIFVTGGSAPEVEPGPPLPAPGPEAVPALPRWSAEAPR